MGRQCLRWRRQGGIVGPVTIPSPAGLTERERAVLEFEASWWLLAGSRPKRQAIREELGISPTSYYATVEALIDRPDAELAQPLVIARLRRRRTERRRARFLGEPVRRHR